MLRIVLAEDEVHLLAALKQKLLDTGQDVAIVGEALDGAAALETLERVNADVLITDIRMPVMDGLELIRQVRTRFPAVTPVIVSGYNDFEYARQALRMQVTEFLLKPVTVDDLSLVVATCKAHVEAAAFEAYDRSLRVAVAGTVSGGRQPEQDRLCYLMFVCFGNMVGQDNALLCAPAEQIDPEAIEQHIMAKLSVGLRAHVLAGSFPNERYLAFATPEQPALKARALAQSVYEFLNSGDGVTVTCVYDRSPRALMHVGPAARALRAEASMGMLLGTSQFLQVNESHPAKPYRQMMSPDALMKLPRVNALQRPAVVREELSQACKAWHAANYPLAWIARELAGFVGSLKHVLLPDMDIIEFERSLDLHNAIFISNSYDELLSNLMFLIDDVFFHRPPDERGQARSTAQMIEHAENIMKLSLATPISLRDIAERVGVSQVYLCRIFRGAKHMSPMDYFTHMRIDKAREYIAAYQEMKLKDIAALVGYDNQYYFSRVFRSVVGMSPSAYREHIEAHGA